MKTTYYELDSAPGMSPARFRFVPLRGFEDLDPGSGEWILVTDRRVLDFYSRLLENGEVTHIPEPIERLTPPLR